MTQPKPLSQEKPSVLEKLKVIRRLKKFKKLGAAELAGGDACRRFPKNKNLLSEHADTAILQQCWPSAIKRLSLLLAFQGNDAEADRSVLRLVNIYVSLGQLGEGRRRLSEALDQRPDSLPLRKAMAELHLLDPQATADPNIWRTLAAAPELEAADAEIRVKVVAACVAGLRLADCADEARTLLAHHFHPQETAWTEHLKDGFAKVFLFDNGRTRMEYYTKLFDVSTLEITASTQLAVTFDPMGHSWNREPFAYKPLIPKSTDFLSVRKRGQVDFHQDFSREDFLRIAIPVAARYQDCVALGQSLGGYSALYYGCWLPGCRVLACAPRNPQNPKYSNLKYARYDLFRHEYDMPRNEAATPTIVYDEKNSEEGPYIKNSLRHCFPNANYVSYPLCGHSITYYLMDVGLLKSSTLGFCEGIPFPKFDRSLRVKSSEYMRNLAKLNFAVGRKRWALALLAKAVELGDTPVRTQRLLAKMDPPPTIIKEPPPPVKPLSPSARIKKWFVKRVIRRGKKIKNSSGNAAKKPM